MLMAEAQESVWKQKSGKGKASSLFAFILS